jgi:type VII secretion protein EccB
MQTKKDQVKAYQFSTSRLVSAVTAGDTGNGQAPFRRAGTGMTVGIILACVGTAGALVWGLLHPVVKTTWKTQGAIVVSQTTGTTFIYLGGELHPVANYASALLVSGANESVQIVPAADLAGVPEGDTIGIPGAPETMPTAGALRTGGWAICLDPASPGTTVLDLAPPSHLAAPPAEERILVTAPGGAQYVVWDGTKYPLPDKTDLAALGLGNAIPVTASAVWLDALPSGPALVPDQVPDRGKRGPDVAGRPAAVGDLFETTVGGVQQYYELRTDGLAPISGTELALVAAAPGEHPPVQVSPADIASTRVSADKSLLSGLPDIMSGPEYGPGAPALCVRESSQQSSGQASDQAGTGTLVTESAARVSAATTSDGAGVIMPTGDGMIIQPPAATGTFAQPPVYLVTDTGEKYELTGTNTTSTLGYGSATPQVMPPDLVNLLPSGPALSVTAAQKPVTS